MMYSFSKYFFTVLGLSFLIILINSFLVKVLKISVLQNDKTDRTLVIKPKMIFQVIQIIFIFILCTLIVAVFLREEGEIQIDFLFFGLSASLTGVFWGYINVARKNRIIIIQNDTMSINKKEIDGNIFLVKNSEYSVGRGKRFTLELTDVNKNVLGKLYGSKKDLNESEDIIEDFCSSREVIKKVFW